MARPTTKNDLLTAANTNLNKLFKLIESMSEHERSTPFNFSNQPNLTEAHWSRDQNIRDVLIHLYEWHQLLIHWVERNQSGESAAFLPEPYNWKTIADMNQQFWQQHQTTTEAEAVKLLRDSHEAVIALIDGFSNDALFAKQYFDWTGTTSLGSYCVSATSSHYEWAMKKLRKHRRLLQSK